MMYRSGLISVILPIYNVAKWLPRCIESIQRNTFRKLEIICVNDGSLDNSRAILDAYAQLDSRIIIIDKPNGGVHSARNKGLEVATGEYVAFIDPDDWIHERYFEFLYRAIISGKYDLAACGFIKTTDQSTLTWPVEYSIAKVSSGAVMRDGVLKSYVWSKLYRHELLDGLTFDKTERIDDTVFVFDMFLKYPNFSLVYVTAPLYAYYQRGSGSLTSTFNAEVIYSLAVRYSKIFPNCQSELIKEILAEESFKRAINAGYYFKILSNKEKVCSCKELMRKAKRYIKKRRILYEVLTICPELYRVWRVLKDPTMRQYENRLKEIARHS